MNDTLTLYLATTEIDLAKPAARVARALERLDEGVRIRVISGRAGEPLADSTARAAGADAVVVLTAHLYGWVPAEEDGGDGRRSVTWLECQAAAQAGKPVLAYVLDSLSDWTHRTSPTRRARATAGARIARQLEQFKRWLRHEAQTVETFENPSQLPDLVSFSVLSFARQTLAPQRVPSHLTTLEDLAALDASLGPLDEPEELELDEDPQLQGRAQATARHYAPRAVRIETVRDTATRDRPTAVDALGRAPVVDALARLLASEHAAGPLTVSVEGPAGTGKSSFLLQLRARLQAVRPGGIHVSFDAWRPGSEPWKAWALELVGALERSVPIRERARVAWRIRTARDGGIAVARLIAGLAGVGLCWALPLLALALPASVAPAASLTALALACVCTAVVLLVAATTVRAPVQRGLARALDADDAGGQEELALSLALLAGEGSLTCYIDDLDRCAPAQIADLLRVQERLGEVLPLVTVLAMDPCKVARALARLTEEEEGAGREALERFVQLPVTLPRPDAGQLWTFVDQALDPRAPDAHGSAWSSGASVSRGAPAVLSHFAPEVEPRPEALEVQLGRDSATVRELVLALAPGLDHNPRRLKRFVNAFRLSAYVASATGLFAAPVSRGRHPLTLQQLGKVVALSQRWPALLQELVRQPELAGSLEQGALRGLPASADDSVQHWLADGTLATLLRAGVTTGEDSDEQARAGWSLALVDWRCLSPLAPAVAPVARIGDAGLFPPAEQEELPVPQPALGVLSS